MFKELAKYKELVYFLVHKELRIRYRNTIFGFFWTLLEPLGLMLIYTVVFSMIMRFGDKVDNYPLFLLSGLIPWMFVSQSLQKGTRSLTSNQSLIKKVYFPRQIFPLTTIIANLVNFVMALLLVFAFVIVLQGNIFWSRLIFLPFIILLQAVFVYGVALFLSVANVFYKDVEFILTVALRGWMYLCPIIYPLEQVPQEFLDWYLLNPMAVIISLYRWALLGFETAPLNYVFYAIGLTFVVLAISWLAFNKLNRRVGEVI